MSRIVEAIESALTLDTTITIHSVRVWLRGQDQLLVSDAEIAKAITATKKFRKVAKGLWAKKS